MLLGGDEFDDVTPNEGDDFVDLGGDNNRFELEARRRQRPRRAAAAGRDSLFFLGSADAERVRAHRATAAACACAGDVGAIDMDLDGIEEIDTLAARRRRHVQRRRPQPAPRWTSSTSASRPRFGSPGGDGQADRVDGGRDRPRAIA